MAKAGKWAPVALLGLIALALYRAEKTHSQLQGVVASATDATGKAEGALKKIDESLKQIADISREITSVRETISRDDCLLHGKMLFYQQKYKEAVEVLREAVRTQPQNPDFNFWLGVALLRSGDPGTAYDHLESAAGELKTGHAWSVAGEAAFRMRDHRRAVKCLEEALRLGKPNREETQILLAKSYLQIDPGKAKQLLSQIVNANPYNGNAVDDLVAIMLDEGDCGGAIALCDKVLVANDRNWGVLVSRAEALIQRGGENDTVKAREDLAKAKLGNPRDIHVYRIEGLLHMAQAEKVTGEAREQELREAVSVFREGIKKIPAPHQGLLQSLLCSALIILKDFQQAEEAAKRAVEMGPQYVNNHLAYCSALLAMRRWAALQRSSQKARECGGRAGLIHGLLYGLLACLLSHEKKENVRDEMAELSSNLRAMPNFLAHRPEWATIMPLLAEVIDELPEPEKQIANAICSFRGGTMSCQQLVTILEASLQ